MYSLRQTNIIGLKLIQANSNKNSRCLQCPVEQFSRLRNSLCGEVINDAGLEPNVRMDENSTAENRIGCGVQGSGGEWCNRERDQSSGNETLECPVVGAVRRT